MADRWIRPSEVGRTLRGVLEQPGAITLAACVFAAVVVSVFSVSCQSIENVVPGRSASLPADHASTEPVIRVRIGEGLREAEIAGAKLVLVRQASAAPVLMTAPIKVRADSGSWTLTDANGRDRAGTTGESLRLTPADPRQGAAMPVLRVAKTDYAGGLEILFPMSGGASFDVINELPLETYLPGVLARELYADWPAEAYRAQAVAARSYALHEMARSRSRDAPFDIEGTPVDQAYAGAAGRRVAIEAARATRGQALTWRGEVLRAYYSSTCGGRSAAAAEQWPIGAGFEFNLAKPIQAFERDHACEDSPVYRWRIERSVADVSARLKTWGQVNGSDVKTLGQVASITETKHNSAGRPSRYTVRDVNGKKATLNSEQLRLALNYPARGFPAPERAESARSGDVHIDVRGGRVVISGRGFGHGVGMCQYCARAMALRGEPYKEMLMRFYPGARIDRVY